MSVLSLDQNALNLLFRELTPESVVKLCNTNMQLRELCRRYNLWRYASGEFEKLNGDQLSLIQRYQEPYEVVAFCTSTDRLLNICNRGNFWNNMMGYHYSDVNYGTTKEDARRAYLQLTVMTYIMSYNTEDSDDVDNLGNKFLVTEDYNDLNAYLVPPRLDTWNDYGITEIRIKASEIRRENIWITVDEQQNVVPFGTRSDAIQHITDMIEISEVMKVVWKDTEREKYFITSTYSRDVLDDVLENNIVYNLNEHVADDDVEVTIVTQAGLDRLSEMGYLQLDAEDSMEQVKAKLYDYIDDNGFFYFGVDFNGEEIYPEHIRFFKILRIKLINHAPDWINLDA